ncbi:MAG: hypothetical protein LUD12_03460 [Lachnospiraceae bacterium]|nr:hypothetical protein [Lachnospiraceae bacterium]
MAVKNKSAFALARLRNQAKEEGISYAQNAPKRAKKRLDMLCHTVKRQKMPFDMFAQTTALHVTSISFSRAMWKVSPSSCEQ